MFFHYFVKDTNELLLLLSCRWDVAFGLHKCVQFGIL